MNPDSDAARKNPLQEPSKASTDIAGLDFGDVQKLREQYGYNELPEEKTNPAKKFLAYFWGPIPWMIEAAAILSAIISHWEDLAIILLMLLINAVVGFIQEKKAENAIALLKKRLAPTARVVRNGTWQQVAARELVPGDIVHIRLGDIIPADVMLLSGGYLELDESALTGESLPVEKKEGATAYSGSIVRQGEMDARVTETGEKTYFGRTTRLLTGEQPKSHFQKAIIRIGDYLIVLAVVLVSIVSAVSLYRGESIPDTLQFALILVVAAIPAALPAVLTVTLAVGAVSLAKREAIVSRLSAIEELAGMDILCSDKTGTITKNEIRVGKLRPLGTVGPHEVLLAAAFASKKESNDPIDSAILSYVRESGILTDSLQHRVTVFVPFDPVTKYSKADVLDDDESKRSVAKGAPQAIASLTHADEKIVAQVNSWVEEFAKKGYRSLGVAGTNPSGSWVYLGVLGLFDPPRDDAAATIKRAEELGVDVKIVTGDHAAIAQEIAQKIGLGTKIVPQSAMIAGNGNDTLRQFEQADGFAQVFPESKFQIIRVLQEGNHIVGMTGDGVNDAPALRQADTGIAVAGATDAAKAAADIVLTRPGLSVIIDAVNESRAIFRRMESYAVYRIAETVRVLIFLTLCIVLLNFYPVTALMIVVLAILNDLPIMMIAYDNAAIAAKPVRWQMNRILSTASILGILGVVSSFLLFLAALWFHLDSGVIQTLVFLKLAVAGHMTIYLARTGQAHFWEQPLPALALFGVAELTQVAATIIAVYGVFMTPLGWTLAAIVWGYALLFFVINDQLKVYIFRKIHPYS
ncbi:MAG: plasma-membrane proton-efflux P-type ATPase [Methanoregula sp.]|jgi:H+-transporting ATPase